MCVCDWLLGNAKVNNAHYNKGLGMDAKVLSWYHSSHKHLLGCSLRSVDETHANTEERCFDAEELLNPLTSIGNLAVARPPFFIYISNPKKYV